MFTKKVNKTQRALVFQGGEYKRFLMPGSYFLPSAELKYFSVLDPFLVEYSFNLLKEDKELMAQLEVIEVSDHEIVIHKEDGTVKQILTEGRHLFWKTFIKHEFIRVNLNEPEVDSNFDTSLFSNHLVLPYLYITTIAVSEIGVLIVDEKASKVLDPGNYFFWKNPNLASKYVKKVYTIEAFSLLKRFTPTRELNFYLELPELASKLEVLDILDSQLALHYEDEKFKDVLTVGKYAYWKTPIRHKFIVENKNKAEVSPGLDPSLFTYPEVLAHAWYFFVEAHEKGLLILDKKFSRVLEPGAYHYWKCPVGPTMTKVDMRLQQLEVNGQEIMTRDKVALRINFVCQYSIVDPVKAGLEIKDYQTQLYMILQLALREYLGSQLLDDILDKKEDVSTFILDKIKTQATELGIEISWAGIKDVILPGDVKDILNQVLIAEKKAQANVITRREETASTRSLLNTAKLMDENETLFKLKELEYIERISEKINQISLGGGSEMLEQLRALLMPKNK